MFDIAVHYLNPSQSRANTLRKTIGAAEEISEAVREINLRPGERLLGFLCLRNRDVISHVCWGRRGHKAATQLRRLNLDSPKEISPINVSELRSREGWSEFIRFFDGRDVFYSADDSREFVAKMRAECQDVDLFIKAAETDYGLIDELTQDEIQIVRQEHDAVEMALRIANMTPRKSYRWSPSQQGKTAITSFFTGLEPASHMEDDVVRWDVARIPGYDLLRETVFGHYVLEDGGTILHTFHANKNALEHTLGVDLIYFNEQHESFVLVQYKMAEPQGNTHVFRFPDKQLEKEIDRMDRTMEVLANEVAAATNQSAAFDFRLTASPFFLKICPRDAFEPDENEQVKGMIIPLDMWKAVTADTTNKFLGPAGGGILSFDNCPRYFDNTQFISIMQSGWVGTSSVARSFLEQVITEIVNSGKSLVLAAKLRSRKEEAPAPVRTKKKARKGVNKRKAKTVERKAKRGA